VNPVYDVIPVWSVCRWHSEPGQRFRCQVYHQLTEMCC